MAKKSKRKTKPKKTVKKKTNYLPIVILAVIVIIAVLIFSSMKPTFPGTNGGTGGEQEQPGQQTGGSSTTDYSCKRSSECFLASCKSKPAIVECVNSIAQELYYKNCINYVDVKITQDITKCSCVQGVCQSR